MDNTDVKVYKKNFITNAIFKVNFPKIDLNENPPEDLKKKISTKFPNFNLKKKANVDVRVKNGKTITTNFNEIISWEFMTEPSKEKVNRFIIHPNYFSLEYENYSNFKSFNKDIKLVFDVFNEFFPIETVKRVGLRYINQIILDSGKPLEWDKLLHPSLFSIYNGFLSDSDDILRSMHVLELEDNDYFLRFQFGSYNSEYPNPIARKEFVLDYDCFLNEDRTPYEIFKIAEDSNKIIYKWFEKSIKEGLRDIMGMIKDE